jgi:hypothetical protein
MPTLKGRKEMDFKANGGLRALVAAAIVLCVGASSLGHRLTNKRILSQTFKDSLRTYPAGRQMPNF